jgi:hypothetical protein
VIRKYKLEYFTNKDYSKFRNPDQIEHLESEPEEQDEENGKAIKNEDTETEPENESK